MARLKLARHAATAATGIALAATVPAVSAAAGWHPSVRVPLPSDAAADPNASLGGIACSGAVSCVAGGSYASKSGHQLAIIATESGGRRRSPVVLRLPAGARRRAIAVRLPGNAAANPDAELDDIGCPSGTCRAVGSYQTGRGIQAMAVIESAGKWQRPAQIRLPAGAVCKDAFLSHVTCSCTADGYYLDGSGHSRAMAASRG